MDLHKIITSYFPEIISENLTLIQIGANDGLQSDPFRQSIIDYKIDSYLLEPIPEFYNMLQNNYSKYKWVNCFNLAITTKNGDQEIEYVP